MTCRNEILMVAKSIVEKKGKNEFSMDEIIRKMDELNTHYKESSIRTHICSRMCTNAPKNHAIKYDDLYRIERGLYRLTFVEKDRT